MWTGLNSGGDNSLLTGSLINGNAWHHLAAVNTGSVVRLYLDGQDTGQTLSSGLALDTYGWYLGAQHYYGGGAAFYHQGGIDEFRFSNSARSADWIATEFNNQNSPATFYTVYTENQIGVMVAPPTATLYGSQSQQFAATTIGDCSGLVTWADPSGVGSVTAAGLYTAPATIPTQQTATITATSQLDGTASAFATVTLLPPVSVSISPQTGTLSAGQALQYSATLQNTSNTAVTWSINPVVGTISATGLYTAPTVIFPQQTITVTATSVADPTQYGSATLTLAISSLAPLRINSAGPTYTDPAGRVWTTDSGFAGLAQGCSIGAGTFSFTPPSGVDDEYASGRWCAYSTAFQNLSYQFAVPNMNYLMTLKFADPSYATAGQRVFSVSVNGATSAATSNIDVAANAGGQYKPWDVTVPVTVTAGQITIAFKQQVSSPIINAIEIVAANSVQVLPQTATLAERQMLQFTAPTPGMSNSAVTWAISPATLGSISTSGLYTAPATITTAAAVTITATSVASPNVLGIATVNLSPTDPNSFTPVRINSAGPTYTDPAGRVWTTDSGFAGLAQGCYIGAGTFSFTPPSGVDEEYASGRWCANSISFQNLSYQFTVPNMDYLVTLKFADPSYAVAGQRVFSVSLNRATSTATSNIDVAANAGGQYKPWDVTVPVTVTGGQITIVFTQQVSSPIVNAIEIMAAGEVQLIPANGQLWRSQSLQFTGVVEDATNRGVTWTLNPTGLGVISAGGLYTAPAAIATPQSVTVTATAAASPNLAASTTLNLWPPVQVALSPASASLTGGQTQQFTSTLTYNGGMGVTWSMSPAGMGSISAAGLYTAPPAIYTPQTVTVIATSAADGYTGTATINLVPTVTVSITPAAATLGPSELQQFTANVSGAWNTAVNWSINPAGMGSITSAGTNLFVFGGVQDGSGNNLLLLVDTTNPLNPIVTPYPAAAPIRSMVVAGNVLHTSSAAGGYVAYQIPGITPTQYGLSGNCGGPVAWTLNLSTTGSITAAGVYTTLASISGTETVTVTATGVTDPTQTAASTVTLSNALTLSLTAVSPGPFVTGGAASFVATLASQGGVPVAGVTVNFTAAGANVQTASAVTDGNGHAGFTYIGAARGTDTIQASTTANGGFTSNSLSALWATPANPITTTPVAAEFFTASSCPSGCEAFTTPATQVPVFLQSFPNLMFDPLSGMLANNNTGVSSSTRPFTDIVLDATGAPTGVMVAQGNSAQAGVGSLAGFSAVFRGSFVVTQAGSYTFNVGSADGFIFGVGSGAAPVSGVSVNPPASSVTVFSQYPVMGVDNGPSSGSPAPGSYPYEFDYKSGTGGALSLAVTVTHGSGTVGLRPLDSLVLTSGGNASHLTGQAASFTVQATDETGSPLAQLPVTVGVTGANSQTLEAVTDSTGKATVSYTGAAAGTDVLEASATLNGMSLGSGQLTATWIVGQAPQITVTGDQVLTLPNPGLYTATVTDPVAPAGGAITVNWTQASGPGTVTFEYPTQLVTHAVFTTPGNYVLQITATDSLGSNSLQIGVTVNAAAVNDQGWIGSPLNQSHVSGVVPATVVSGETLQSGTLTVYPVWNPSAVVTLNANTIGSGQIGSLDITVLNDGVYYVLLEATDSTGKSMGSSIWLNVVGDYKPGRVTTTVTDLVVPAPGLPIQIGRTYDSLLRGASGDFGYGWSLGINVQLEIANTLDITLTLNGQRRTFYFTPQSQGALNFLYLPQYTQEPGLYGSLQVTANCGANLLVKTGDIYICAIGYDLYQPLTLVYTDAYGRIYTLFENQTKLGRANLLGYAKSLGLDLAAFQQALDRHSHHPIVERDLGEAAGLGATTMPTFFVNGRLVGPQGYASLGAVSGHIGSLDTTVLNDGFYYVLLEAPKDGRSSRLPRPSSRPPASPPAFSVPGRR
jgi:hypothetical protein